MVKKKHLEKYKSQLGKIIPYIMENKKCSKPPTSNGIEFVCCLSVFNKHYINLGMSPYFTNKDGLPPEETKVLEIRIAYHRAEMGPCM